MPHDPLVRIEAFRVLRFNGVKMNLPRKICEHYECPWFFFYLPSFNIVQVLVLSYLNIKGNIPIQIIVLS